MAMIPLKQYAEKLGKNPVVAAQKAARGGFTTARKIGCQWFIEESEPYGDNRVTSGRYVGRRRPLRREPNTKE